MTNAVFFDNVPGLATTMEYPSTRGRSMVNGLVSVTRQLLATDSIGYYTLTLTNVVIGSRIHIQVQTTGDTVDDEVAATSTVVIAIPYYVSGNPANDVYIKVRNASGTPSYKPWQTQISVTKGAGSIFVSQDLD